MDLDLAAFHFLNSFAGRWYGLDLFFAIMESNNLLKGAPFIAGLVWFWFQPSAGADRRRAVVINTLLSVFIALVVNRVLAVSLPYRRRPMYDPTIPFNDPHVDVTVHFNMENWTSFPSDTATFFFAMVAGFWLISRRAALGYGLYALAFICTTRIYLGVHWPSDILVGGLIGFFTTLGVHGLLRDRLARPLLALEHRSPHWLYAAGFLAAFEVSAMLGDLRQRGLLVSFVRDLNAYFHSAPLLANTVLAGIAALCVGVTAMLLIHRRRVRSVRQALDRPRLESSSPDRTRNDR